MTTLLSPSELHYQLAHWQENLSPEIVAVDVVLIVIAAIVVLLRLISRRIKVTPLQADDYMVMVALFATCILTIQVILCARFGMGKHIVRVAKSGQQNVVSILKMQYAIEITWNICTFLVNLSILLLFHRIFGRASPRFRICLIITAGFLFTWTFGSLMSAVFRCLPVHYFWNKTIKGTCPNAEAGRIATAALDIVMDVIMFVLPVPMVWRLILPLRQKLAVAAIFGVGIFSLAASATRLSYSIRITAGNDPTYRNAGPVLWATVEPCTGIVCACLPVLKPIFSAESSSFSTPGISRLGNWLQNALSFSGLSSLRSESGHAEPQLVSDEKAASGAAGYGGKEKGKIRGFFTRFPSSTVASASSNDSEDSFATAPRSPTVNRHISATYSEAVGQYCWACGGTGIEPPMDVDVEKGKARMETVTTEVTDNDDQHRADMDRQWTIHDVRRWGRDNICESGIWGHGRVNI